MRDCHTTNADESTCQQTVRLQNLTDLKMLTNANGCDLIHQSRCTDLSSNRGMGMSGEKRGLTFASVTCARLDTLNEES